jgi:Holliday junction resolvase RusA-like endonuclease
VTLTVTVLGTPAWEGDREWALNLYGLLGRGGDDEALFYAVVDGDPWSKSRPRFTRRGRTYQPRDDEAAEQALKWRLKAAGARPFPGNVMLVCRFYRANYQRIDADNLLKHVCDSANGILWADDSQVTLVLGEVLYDAEHPRTVILAGNHASTLLRGVDAQRPCEHCGKLYQPTPGRKRDEQRFCSRECNYAGRVTVLTDRACGQCGDTFHPTTKTQFLCSAVCRAESLRAKRKAKATPLSNCSECGKQLTHRRGGRCRDCWRANSRTYE